MTDLVLDALASWRLVRLIQKDEITAPARTAIVGWTLDNDHPQLRYLLQCPHCLSPHCVILLLCLRRIAPGPTRILTRVFAASALVSMYYEISGLFQEPE